MHWDYSILTLKKASISAAGLKNDIFTDLCLRHSMVFQEFNVSQAEPLQEGWSAITCGIPEIRRSWVICRGKVLNYLRVFSFFTSQDYNQSYVEYFSNTLSKLNVYTWELSLQVCVDKQHTCGKCITRRLQRHMPTSCSDLCLSVLCGLEAWWLSGIMVGITVDGSKQVESWESLSMLPNREFVAVTGNIRGTIVPDKTTLPELGEDLGPLIVDIGTLGRGDIVHLQITQENRFKVPHNVFQWQTSGNLAPSCPCWHVDLHLLCCIGSGCNRKCFRAVAIKLHEEVIKIRSTLCQPCIRMGELEKHDSRNTGCTCIWPCDG